MRIVPIIMLAAIAATPASAGPVKKKRMHHSQGFFIMQKPNWGNSRAQYRGGDYMRGPNVYSPAGRFIGRDPSPAVRQQMYDYDQRIRGPL